VIWSLDSVAAHEHLPRRIVNQFALFSLFSGPDIRREDWDREPTRPLSPALRTI